MNNRDRFIAQVKAEALEKGIEFRVLKSRGKGGHALIFVGDKVSTLPSREIDPKTASKIRKALGLN